MGANRATTRYGSELRRIGWLDSDQCRPDRHHRGPGYPPGQALNGFPPGLVVGATHAGDAVALQAQSDLVNAYNALDQGCTQTFPGAADLVGLTLGPGVYCSASSLFLSGTLTLDGQFNPNAVWVFKTGSTLITASSSTVQMINERSTLQRLLEGQQLRDSRYGHDVHRQYPRAHEHRPQYRRAGVR